MNLFLEFIENLKTFGLEKYDRYYSVYPAIVTDVEDPEQRGRIKVTMPSLFDEEEELADWVLPISNPLAGDQTGAFFPPYVDDTVLVMFEYGDVDYPVYIGGFWAQEELPEEFLAGYPNVRGWKFKSGQAILIDENEGKLKISLLNGDTGAVFIIDDTDGEENVSLIHKTGSILQVDKDGNWSMATPEGNLLYLNEKDGEVTIKSASGALVSMKEKVVISDKSGKNTVSITDSSVEVNSSGDVVVSASNVAINAGNVVLGKDSDNAVLYSKLATIFDSHIHPTAVGPSGPPGPSPTMTMSGTESIPPLSAKAGNVKLRGNI